LQIFRNGELAMPRSKNAEAYPSVFLELIQAVMQTNTGEIVISCKSHAEAVEWRNKYYAYLAACEHTAHRYQTYGGQENLRLANHYRAISRDGRSIMVRLDKASHTLLFCNRHTTEEVMDFSDQLKAQVGGPVPQYQPIEEIKATELDEKIALDVIRKSASTAKTDEIIHQEIEKMNKDPLGNKDAPDPEQCVITPKGGDLDEFLKDTYIGKENDKTN